jgi:hypothetical protein
MPKHFIHSFIRQLLYSPLLGPSLFFNFVMFFLYADGRTPWTSDQPVARPLPTYGPTQTRNEPTIPVFERTKLVYALDRARPIEL